MLSNIIEKFMFNVNILLMIGSIYSLFIVEKGTAEYIVSCISLLITFIFLLLFVIYKLFVVRYFKDKNN